MNKGKFGDMNEHGEEWRYKLTWRRGGISMNKEKCGDIDMHEEDIILSFV